MLFLPNGSIKLPEEMMNKYFYEDLNYYSGKSKSNLMKDNGLSMPYNTLGDLYVDLFYSKCENRQGNIYYSIQITDDVISELVSIYPYETADDFIDNLNEETFYTNFKFANIYQDIKKSFPLGVRKGRPVTTNSDYQKEVMFYFFKGLFSYESNHFLLRKVGELEFYDKSSILQIIEIIEKDVKNSQKKTKAVKFLSQLANLSEFLDGMGLETVKF